MPPRFLQLADVAEILNISPRAAYALVKSRELPAIQVGGRRQWRVEHAELEAYIARKYAEAQAAPLEQQAQGTEGDATAHP